MNITEQTRVIDLTVGELIDLFNNMNKLKQEPTKVSNYCDDEFIHGYAGLANYLKCSQFCIYQRIKSGKYDNAIIRNGKKIIFKRSEIVKVLESKPNCKKQTSKKK